MLGDIDVLSRMAADDLSNAFSCLKASVSTEIGPERAKMYGDWYNEYIDTLNKKMVLAVETVNHYFNT